MNPPLTTKCRSGGGGGGGGGGDIIEKGCVNSPFACCGQFLILMRFIDPTRPQENVQIGGVRCAISQIWPPSLGKCWVKTDLADI